MKCNCHKHYQKILNVFGLILFMVELTNAQNLQHIWAKSGGGTDGESKVVASALDGSDNLYIFGTFSCQQVTFDAQSHINEGQQDIFLVKYDPSGNVLWSKTYGGTSNDFAKDVKVDHSGNVIITGYFVGSKITFDNDTLHSSGGSDLFLVKLNSNGNVIWTLSSNGNQEEKANSLEIDNSNHIYLTGNYNSISFQLDSLTINLGSGSQNMFVAQFDPQGNIIWLTKSSMHSLSGSGATPNKILIDHNGDLLIGGGISTNGYNGPFYIRFGNDTVFANASAIWSAIAAFVVKFDTLGHFISGVTDTLSSYVNNVVMDSDNNYYISTTRTALIVIGPSFQNFSILKLRSNFQVDWRKDFDINIGLNQVRSMVTTENGFLAFGHYEAPQIRFETDTLQTNAVGNRYYSDLFLISYDSLGTENWVSKYLGEVTERAGQILKSSTNKYYLTGSYESDSISFGNQLLTNSNDTGHYYVHLSPLFFWRHSNTFATQLDIPTNIEEIRSQDKMVAIYPNPTSTDIRIRSDSAIESVEIFNSLGMKTFEKEVDSSKNVRIDARRFPVGIYFVGVRNKNKNYSVTKLIIH